MPVIRQLPIQDNGSPSGDSTLEAENGLKVKAGTNGLSRLLSSSVLQVICIRNRTEDQPHHCFFSFLRTRHAAILRCDARMIYPG
jgi:hypothetical protein